MNAEYKGYNSKLQELTERESRLAHLTTENQELKLSLDFLTDQRIRIAELN
jgi:cell shape-determining protein MreC